MDAMQSGNASSNMSPMGPAGNMGGEEKSPGALIGSIIIILVLIVGGLYLWNSKMQEEQMMNEMMGGEAMMGETPGEGAMMQDEMMMRMESQGSSDETGDIEKDLNATSFEGVDAELNNL